MTIEISLVELQLHVAAELAPHGVGVEAFEVLPDVDGGWRIQLYGPDENQPFSVQADAVRQVEANLGRRYKVHRLSLGGLYGG